MCAGGQSTIIVPPYYHTSIVSRYCRGAWFWKKHQAGIWRRGVAVRHDVRCNTKNVLCIAPWCFAFRWAFLNRKMLKEKFTGLPFHYFSQEWRWSLIFICFYKFEFMVVLDSLNTPWTHGTHGAYEQFTRSTRYERSIMGGHPWLDRMSDLSILSIICTLQRKVKFGNISKFALEPI